MGIFVQESSLRNISFLIQGCLFDGNFAESFGGGLYLYVAGSKTNHTFTVENSTFTRNVAGKGSFGGGLQVAMLIQNLDRPPTRFDFIGCHFEDNMADYGGGLSTVQVSTCIVVHVHASQDLLMLQVYSQGAGNLVSISECTFVNNRANNVGSALMFASFLYVQNRNESLHYVTSNK